MSQIEREKEVRADRRAKARQQKRMQERDDWKKRSPVDVDDMDATLLKAVISTVIGSGGALRIGATRDGGAWAFGLYLDGEYKAEYVGSDESINDYLRSLGDFFGETGDA